MADCASLLDEELSSFVFNYLTENSGSQYGEEEVCSDRLDTDFPDIDLSQLDASDFDSVNCLSELHWCNDQSDISAASIQYSTGDPEFFEIEDENAALLAALTDSLDGMVEDEVGGLSVFPSLGEGSEEDLPFPSGSLSDGSLSSETEDPSLLKKLLLSPPNMPTGLESHKEGSSNSGHRHCSRSLHLKPVRPLVKRESTQERKPRAVRPAGRLCTELHRHLTSAQEAEDTPSADTEDEEDEEEDDDDEDSESEEEEEEEEESSSSESERSTPLEPTKPQFSSEKELKSVVELIKYMHTYCLPMRKQAGWERKERECPGQVRRARPEYPTTMIHPNCHKAAPQAQSSAPRPRLAFTRRREVKANSLLRELLKAVNSFDVSKPYRLHSPPYTHNRDAITKPAHDRKTETPSPTASSTKPELMKEHGLEAPLSPDLEDASFSVRRSRRLASFPSRFAKKVRAGRVREEPASGERRPDEEDKAVKHPLGDDPEKDSAANNNSTSQTTADAAEPDNLCCQNEKRACLCLPLTPKSTGETQFANRPFEQTLSVDLCGTAGLTPPTTPPHKQVEDELFKPEGKVESPPKGSWLTRAHSRKLPEQTELYAQLRKMGQAIDAEPKVHRTFGDHDYCLLSLGESRKRTAAMLAHSLFGRSSPEGPEPKGDRAERRVQGDKRLEQQREDRLFSKVPEYLSNGNRADRKGDALSPHNSDEEGERSSRSPSPILHSSCCQPHSPSSKPDFSCENSETCHGDKQRNKISKSVFQIDEDNCQVFYIHNLPSSVTQTMLRKRFEAFGDPEDCKVITKHEERCGVIKFRPAPSGQQIQRHRREPLFQNGGGGMHRLSRKRYIDLDEAGPGPVKSKYDALDFDTLLKEAQKSLHR